MTPKMRRSISTVAVALLATCGAQVTQATSSFADEPRKNGYHATATDGTVMYSFDNSMAPGVSTSPFYKTDGSLTDLGKDATSAVSAWNAAVGKQLLKRSSGTTPDGIAIIFHAKTNSDGFFNQENYYTAQKVTVTGMAVPSQSGKFTRIDIWLNLNDPSEEISITNSNEGQIGTITHEIGHALGLDHPDTANVDDDPRRCPEVMNYGCSAVSNDIGPNEAKLVQAIYGIGNSQQFDVPEVTSVQLSG